MSIYRLWSILSGEWGVGGDEGAGGAGGDEEAGGEELITNAQCPMPNAQCPMPNAQCPMPNSQSLELHYFLLHYICLVFLKSGKQTQFRYLIRF
jgi:hypothetical protein